MDPPLHDRTDDRTISSRLSWLTRPCAAVRITFVNEKATLARDLARTWRGLGACGWMEVEDRKRTSSLVIPLNKDENNLTRYRDIAIPTCTTLCDSGPSCPILIGRAPRQYAGIPPLVGTYSISGKERVWGSYIFLFLVCCGSHFLPDIRMLAFFWECTWDTLMHPHHTHTHTWVHSKHTPNQERRLRPHRAYVRTLTTECTCVCTIPNHQKMAR